MTVANIVLGLGTLLTALHAGLLYDFSVDIVPSLRSIRPKAPIEMMQAINVKIENPRFFVSFLGSILLLPLATFPSTTSSPKSTLTQSPSQKLKPFAQNSKRLAPAGCCSMPFAR